LQCVGGIVLLDVADIFALSLIFIISLYL